MILDKELINNLITKAQASERLRMNYNLHESLEAKAQRLFNALEPGTELPIHRHLHSAETYILLRGHIDVVYYNDAGEVTNTFKLSADGNNFGIHIPKGQWHTVVVHESSVIFEVKDGPYTPLDNTNILRK